MMSLSEIQGKAAEVALAHSKGLGSAEISELGLLLTHLVAQVQGQATQMAALQLALARTP